MFMTGWDIVEHGGTYHSDPEYPRILRLKKTAHLANRGAVVILTIRHRPFQVENLGSGHLIPQKWLA